MEVGAGRILFEHAAHGGRFAPGQGHHRPHVAERPQQIGAAVGAPQRRLVTPGEVGPRAGQRALERRFLQVVRQRHGGQFGHLRVVARTSQDLLQDDFAAGRVGHEVVDDHDREVEGAVGLVAVAEQVDFRQGRSRAGQQGRRHEVPHPPSRPHACRLQRWASCRSCRRVPGDAHMRRRRDRGGRRTSSAATAVFPEAAWFKILCRLRIPKGGPEGKSGRGHAGAEKAAGDTSPRRRFTAATSPSATRPQCSCSASQRSASIAAMQPVPAEVMACRYTWSCTSPQA